MDRDKITEEKGAYTMPPLMTLEQKRADRLKMITWAMEEKAPAYYRSLKKSRALQRVVEEREADMMQAYLEGQERILDAWVCKEEPDTLKKIREYETATRELWEQVMVTFLEFPD